MSHLRSGVLPGLMVSPLAMGVLGVCPGGWGSLPVLEKWGGVSQVPFPGP